MDRIKKWIKEQYDIMSGFFHREFAPSLRITAIAFGAIVVLTFVVSLFAKDLAASIVDRFAAMVQELGIMDEDGGFSALLIFRNNLQATAVSILYGFIPFLYLPALSLGTNAMILGVMGGYYVNNGHSLLIYLAGILPHGIFELPALIISLALGFYLCQVVVTYVRKNTKGIVGAALKNIARVFLFWVVPLLMVAAATEAYITPLILHLFV